jgi:predicted SnoaL-like aldol condensation-catalyzing enzyme
MDVRQSREALLQAVNAHDVEAIKSFVAESYVARNELGLVLADYRGVMDYAARLFRKHPEYRETLEVETVEWDGEATRVTTHRVESYTGLLGSERSRVARQVETWEEIDGRWVLVEERCLASEGEGVVVPWWAWVS